MKYSDTGEAERPLEVIGTMNLHFLPNISGVG